MAEETDQIAKICWIIEKGISGKKIIYFCLIDYTKAFDCVDQNQLQKILNRWEYQTTLHAFWEICMKVKKQYVESDMEQQTGSKLEKESIKAVYCHFVYLTSMRSTLYEMLGWMKLKLESRLPGELSIASDMQIIPP